MTVFLPDASLLIAYLGATIILAFTPGPNVIYILTRTFSQGPRSGLASVLGITLGNLSNAMAAGFGLAIIFSISNLAFMTVKYLGAFYLLYLGVKTLRDASKGQHIKTKKLTKHTMRRIFIDGFVISLLNPKTMLFFAAILPHFINPNHGAFPQILALTIISVLMGALADTLYVLCAKVILPKLREDGAKKLSIGCYLSGCTYIALALFTALVQNNASH